MARAEKVQIASTIQFDALKSLDVDLNFSLPSRQLTKLLTGLENSLHDNGPILQYVSAYQGEEAQKLAFETSVIAATQQGKRVLLIDAFGNSKHTKKGLSSINLVPLSHTLDGRQPLENSLAILSHSNLVYAMFTKEGGNDDMLADPHQVEKLLRILQGHFDLIVINAEGILTNGIASLFARFIDGSVLVVKAERTREPVLKQVKTILEKDGGKILGCVMTNRKFYIPKIFYKLFFRGA